MLPSILDPPEVSEQNKSIVEEGSQLQINCEVVAGNPEALTTRYWEFQPKYYDSQSQALPVQRKNKQLMINETLYTDAGNYSCTAGNTVGNDKGDIHIIVHCELKVCDLILVPGTM